MHEAAEVVGVLPLARLALLSQLLRESSLLDQASRHYPTRVNASVR